MSRQHKVLTCGIYPLAILIANILIARKLFGLEYSAYLESNEGTFIALARHVAAHPLDLQWWPLWECGLPYVNTYLPLLHLLVGWFSRWTAHSPALAFHQVSAAFFCLGPVLYYGMAWGITRRPHASFLAAFAYSVLSICAWLVPRIRLDLGSLWHLRRLHNLAYYGEGPLTATMAMLPVAILLLYLAATRQKLWMWVAAGVAMGVAILFNAFGAVLLALAGLSLLGAMPVARFWRLLGALAATGALTYAWISPLAPPSVIAAIRTNSPTVEGDFRFTLRTLAGIVILAAGFFLVRWLIRALSPELRFFTLFTMLATAIVILGTALQMYVVPQPHRYQLAMDFGWCMLLIFGGAELLKRSERWQRAAALCTLLLLLAALVHNVRYGRTVVRSIDMTATDSYRTARWLDTNLPGQRVMVPSSYSYQFNDFSDNPQVLGGHEPMLPNFVMRIAQYVLYGGASGNPRDGEISVLWLQALGAHAVVVPGPTSQEIYKPFGNARKFEGLLPVLWQNGGDTVYALPARTTSLAHVLPAMSVVQRPPADGLDVAGIEAYVKALNDPRQPDAPLVWRGWNTAEISTLLHRGQELSVQMTYHPGWRASASGQAVPVRSDGLGFIVLDPPCEGPCNVSLIFDGGTEAQAARVASTAASVIGVFFLVRVWKRRNS